MRFKCCLCGKTLKEPGALLFSPPHPVEDRRYKYLKPESISPVNKLHICKSCYKKLYVFMAWIAAGRTKWPEVK